MASRHRASWHRASGHRVTGHQGITSPGITASLTKNAPAPQGDERVEGVRGATPVRPARR